MKENNGISSTNINDLINTANYLFNQVKLQQEVRDRWFGHYLTIIGSVVAFSTLVLKIFESSISIEILLYIASFAFGLAGVLGVLFYILYQCQRHNYKKLYKLMEELQCKIISCCEVDYSGIDMLFKRKGKGADFYTLLIQNILTSTCFTISIMLVVWNNNNLLDNIILAIVLQLILISILKYLYFKFEKE